MTAHAILHTPSGPVRFRVNVEARDDEPVLVREEEPMPPLDELNHWRSVVPKMLDTIHHHAHVGPDDPKDWRECGWCKRYLPPEAATVNPREALREWLDAKGHGARADLAAEIEVDGSTITYILNGRLNPSDVVARAIERATRIPVSAWPTFNVNHRRSGKKAKR